MLNSFILVRVAETVRKYSMKTNKNGSQNLYHVNRITQRVDHIVEGSKVPDYSKFSIHNGGHENDFIFHFGIEQ